MWYLTRQVLDTAAADQYHRVFLQVMAFTGDIGGDFSRFDSRTLATLRNAELGFFGTRWILWCKPRAFVDSFCEGIISSFLVL